jgi:hypothetical protein
MHTPIPPEVDPDAPLPTVDPDPQPDNDRPNEPPAPEGDPPVKPPPVQAADGFTSGFARLSLALVIEHAT